MCICMLIFLGGFCAETLQGPLSLFENMQVLASRSRFPNPTRDG